MKRYLLAVFILSILIEPCYSKTIKWTHDPEMNATPEVVQPSQPTSNQSSAEAVSGKSEKFLSEIYFDISSITNQAPTVMTESGLMYGINLSFTELNTPGTMFKFESKLSFGTVDYDGRDQLGNAVKVSSVPDFIMELRGLFGLSLMANINTSLIPYLGVGYRYLADNLQQKTTDGYLRESNYLYIPLGLYVTQPLSKDSSFGLQVEYDYFLTGLQVSHISQNDPKYDDSKNLQTSGYGLKWALKYSLDLKNIGLEFKLFSNYWDIGKSQSYDVFPGLPMTEPANNSSETGVSVGIRF